MKVKVYILKQHFNQLCLQLLGEGGGGTSVQYHHYLVMPVVVPFSLPIIIQPWYPAFWVFAKSSRDQGHSILWSGTEGQSAVRAETISFAAWTVAHKGCSKPSPAGQSTLPKAVLLPSFHWCIENWSQMHHQSQPCCLHAVWLHTF